MNKILFQMLMFAILGGSLTQARAVDLEPIPLEVYLKVLIEQSGTACDQVLSLKNCYKVSNEKCKDGFKAVTTQCASEVVKERGADFRVDSTSKSKIARDLGKCSMELFQESHKPAFNKNDPTCNKAAPKSSKSGR